MPTSTHARTRWRRLAFVFLVVVALGYAFLLIPEPAAPPPVSGSKQAFLWKRDAFWTALEKEFQQARALGCEKLSPTIDDALTEIRLSLGVLARTNLPAHAPQFDLLETNFFQLAPMIGACPERLPEFLKAYAWMRSVVKRQSEQWRMDSVGTRDRLYRSLYGGRAAVEEAMLQSPRDKVPLLLEGDAEPSATPSADFQGVKIHSGDILVSRGGAATSALIARGNDFPGNFSHVALAHVDEKTKQVSVIEAHIESGVSVRPIEKYLSEKKLRLMLLRLRADLPPVVAEPMLPHRAATQAIVEVNQRHIAYDFEMDHANPEKQFCSEVASAAYRSVNVKLWMGVSHLSTPGVRAWLFALGVRHFETQEPADLEYDPQLRVVAEWRDPETLFKDHVDNAVIDAMLERAEAGDRLSHSIWLLPGARVAKGWSMLKNRFGAVGPIPEGMSATTALRVKFLGELHAPLYARVITKAEKFKNENGYVAPYWELVSQARQARAAWAFGE